MIDPALERSKGAQGADFHLYRAVGNSPQMAGLRCVREVVLDEGEVTAVASGKKRRCSSSKTGGWWSLSAVHEQPLFQPDNSWGQPTAGASPRCSSPTSMTMRTRSRRHHPEHDLRPIQLRDGAIIRTSRRSATPRVSVASCVTIAAAVSRSRMSPQALARRTPDSQDPVLDWARSVGYLHYPHVRRRFIRK